MESKTGNGKSLNFTVPEKEIVQEAKNCTVLRILQSVPSELPEKRDYLLIKNTVMTLSLGLSDSFISALIGKFLGLNMFVVPIFFIVCLIYNLYSKRYSFWDEVGKITGASFISSLLYLIIFGDLAALWLVAVLPPSVSGVRFLLKEFLWILGVREKVLIVGGGLGGTKVLRAIDSERFLGYDVIGVLDDDRAKLWKPVWRFRGRDVLVIGQTQDIWDILKETPVDEVILAIPSLGDKMLTALASHLQKFVPKVSVVPDMFGLPVLVDIKHSFGEQVLFLTIQNKLANPLNRFIKEVMDKTLASVIFVLTLPVMIIIAILIKIDSPGPVIFAHERVGKGGRKFKCLKFRTMYVNNEEILKRHFEQHPEDYEFYKKTGKIPGRDPRITRVGRFLRKFSLDELPQIINVLKGDMSLVGPRALIEDEVQECREYYMEWARYIKPGITGLAQIMGRANISHEDKNIISIWYMKNWSIWLDIVILIKTAIIVLKTEGAY